jgi:hypothetical protein
MTWLQLDPESVAGRVARLPAVPAPPSLLASLARGVIGFTVVSIAGFLPWALAGGWLKQAIGELGMYLSCAAVFLLLSGPLLYRLILGPGALIRFMVLFMLAFSAYATLWIIAWMTLHGHVGSLVGLASGTAAMGLLFCAAFGDASAIVPVIILLFTGNVLGYYAGGGAEAWVAGLGPPGILGIVLEKPPPRALAMLSWGVCYGIGFGAGIGLAFHRCQTRHRALIGDAGRAEATAGAPPGASA